MESLRAEGNRSETGDTEGDRVQSEKSLKKGAGERSLL